MSFTSPTQFPSSAYISGQAPIEPELREWLQHLEQQAPPENLQQVQEYCKWVVETEQEKEREIALALAKHHRPESSEHEPGMYAVDLIVLNRTPSYTNPTPAMDFLESCSLGTCAPLEDWGPTDEPIIEELSIAAFMMPEILHDGDYNWSQLYDMTSGIPFHTTQGERDHREQITKFHFPSKHDVEVFQGITEEDIRRGEWVLVSAEGTYDREIGVFGRENEEWAECLELSHFKEYDQALDEEYFIVDNKGRPALHNAERHEQRCALNALYNHPELDLKVRITYAPYEYGIGCLENGQEVVEKPNVLDTSGIHGVECSVIASGDNFSAAICRYGGIFVPKRFQALIGDEGNFMARLTISTGGAKYPLRVVEINRC